MRSRRPSTKAKRALFTDLAALYVEPSGLFHKLVAVAGLNPGKDFRDRDLRAMRFVGADVRGFDFSGSDLRGCGLREASSIDATTELHQAILDDEDNAWLRRLRNAGNDESVAFDPGGATITKIMRFPISNAATGNYFTLKLVVGDPAVPVNVGLDTGSSMLVANAAPYLPDADEVCSTTNLLQSGSFQNGDFLAAVVRTRVGLLVDDTAAAVTLPNANLGVVYDSKPALFGDADGILGLAYPALNSATRMPTNTWNTRYDPGQLGLGHLEADLPPYLDQLVAAGLVANKFAFAVQRSVASAAADFLNTGVFVLGGGEECVDLYTGEFSSVAVVHEANYNTNLLAVQVGNRTIQVPPTPEGSAAGSNSFIDSANSGLMLDSPLYQQVIGLFNAVDSTFGPALQAGSRNQTQLNLDVWPALRFILQGIGGAQVILTVQPKHYWQLDGNGRGTAKTGLSSGGAPHPGQSILGLPLFASHYVVFNRTGGRGNGVIKFAAQREANLPGPVA